VVVALAASFPEAPVAEVSVAPDPPQPEINAAKTIANIAQQSFITQSVPSFLQRQTPHPSA